MENYKRIKNCFLLLTLCSFLTLSSCDTFDFPIEVIDENEQLLTREWQYSYILMDGDTIRDLDLNGGGPTTNINPFSSIALRYLIYKDDHSYELRTLGPSFLSLGEGENYQPNYGFWDIETTGTSTGLIHNQIITYEVRYELMQLDETGMVRKQIGDRITYSYLASGEIDTLTVSSWIEVFVPLPK